MAAILLVYVLFGVVLGVVGWATLPSLLKELEEIARRIPRQAVQLEELGQDAVGFFRHLELPGTLRDAVDTLMERVQLALEGLASKLMQVLMDVFTNMVSLIISPILAFYLLRDHQAMRERALRYVPAQYRGDAQYILREINTALNGFFRGQLWICLFVGLFIYVALCCSRYLMPCLSDSGRPFDIIPYFGPVLGFLPAAALAVARSPSQCSGCCCSLLPPTRLKKRPDLALAHGDRVGLHPLAVVFAVLVGGHLMGLIGMLMAIPAAAILRVFLDYFLLRRRQPE